MGIDGELGGFANGAIDEPDGPDGPDSPVGEMALAGPELTSGSMEDVAPIGRTAVPASVGVVVGTATLTKGGLVSVSGVDESIQKPSGSSLVRPVAKRAPSAGGVKKPGPLAGRLDAPSPKSIFQPKTTTISPPEKRFSLFYCLVKEVAFF